MEAVLTSTHNLCFKAKIRKNVYPCKPQVYYSKPQVYYIKVGCKGVYIRRTCFRFRHFFETSFSKDGMLYHFSLSQASNSDTIRYFETGGKHDQGIEVSS